MSVHVKKPSGGAANIIVSTDGSFPDPSGYPEGTILIKTNPNAATSGGEDQ